MFTLTVKTASVFVTEVFMERVFEANASGLEVSFHETYAVFGCRENSTLQITLIYGPFFNKKVVTEINQNFNELRTYPVLFSFFFSLYLALQTSGFHAFL